MKLKEAKSQLESQTKDDKRHCDEIRRQMAELEELRVNLKTVQDKEKLVEANFKHAQKELSNTKDLLEKEKRLNIKYVQEIGELKKKNEEIEKINEGQNRYCVDMKARYEERKREIEDHRAANKEMAAKLERANREIGELKDKVIQSEMRVRSLVEEIRVAEDKNKVLLNKCETLRFASEQFEKQKKEAINRLNNSTAVPLTAASTVVNSLSASSISTQPAFETQHRFKAPNSENYNYNKYIFDKILIKGWFFSYNKQFIFFIDIFILCLLVD